MMRLLTFILVFLSLPAFSGDCHLWSVRGEVTYEKPDFLLISAKETQSETKLVLPLEEQQKLTVFLNQSVEVRVILGESDIPRRAKILKVESATRIIPDPLNDTKSSLFKKLGKRPCP